MDRHSAQDTRFRRETVPVDERLMLKALFPKGTLTIHAGRKDAPWTQLVRAELPQTDVREIDEATPVDSYRRDHRIAHLHHLVVETYSALAQVIAGARLSLAHARIDMVHFRLPPGADLTPNAARLRRDGYILFRAAGGKPQMMDGWSPFLPGYYLAVQERLLPFFLGKRGYGLDFNTLCRNHGIRVRGVVHVGAHEGQEITTYEAMGAEHIVFIEANPTVHARLAAAMKDRPNVTTIERAIADRAGTTTLRITSFDQSSSLLPLAGHRAIYPEIVETGTAEVETVTLDALMTERGYDPARYNFLSIDVQGAELLVLKGASGLLRHVQGLAIEVNFSELYAGCAQIEAIDDCLWDAGFHRAAMASSFDVSWGDAFYVRERPAAK